MDGFYINEKILHGLRQRVKQQAFLGRSLAIFTKQAGTGTQLPGPADGPLKLACLVNCAKLFRKVTRSFDHGWTSMQDCIHNKRRQDWARMSR
jgi:hypothetical protein